MNWYKTRLGTELVTKGDQRSHATQIFFSHFYIEMKPTIKKGEADVL
jgi:hypothetical protein